MQQVTRVKDEEERVELAEQEKRKIKGCLDQLTSMLTTFEDEKDLRGRIKAIFEEFDEDESGTVTFEEVSPWLLT